MFRVVFQRRSGRGSLIALTLVLVVAAGILTSAARPLNVFAASTDTCGYNPLAAPSPNPGGGSVIFNENTVTRAIQFYGVGLSGHVGVFTNDESGLLIGQGGTPSSSAGSSVGTAGSLPANTTVTSIPVPAGLSVAVSSGDQITVTSGAQHQNFHVTANAAAGATSISVQSQNIGGSALTGGDISDPSIVWGQAVPPTFGTGSDFDNRPIAPTIYLTDITSNANATGGDWENGGHAATSGASALYGSWSPTLGTKPVNKNDWDLGPNADTPPHFDAFGGVTTAFDEGYGSEVAWNVPGLTAYDPTTGTFVAVKPGHTYRVQSLTHDTDQNKGNGDVGEVCTTFSIPVANLSITKTADAASVNAGDQVGFTVEIKNTGNAAADGSNLNDPLPAGSGSGVTWAVDNSVGTPAQFVLSGAQGSQTLGLASSTIPIGADYTIHITASTSATECGKYDNTATLTSTDSSPNPASASELCKPASIKILKTADATQVNAGDPIGFTVTVWNSGSGDAYDVNLNDPLPINPGLSWKIDSPVGAGWAGTCAISGGALKCGPVTVPAGTTQALSTFKVHISSTTDKSTGGVCPAGNGVVDNTGSVTTSNDSSGQSEATTCVAAPSIKILKTADATQVNAGDSIGFTVTVYNDGTGDAYGVNLNDPLPINPGLSWKIDSPVGAGWAGTCAISGGALKCGPVTVPAGTTQALSTFKVHISSTTDKSTGGVCPAGNGVVDNTGTVTTSNDSSGQSEATTCVAAPSIKILKTADATQVSAGDPIGFTVTVYNDGTGDAYDVNLNDPLPINPGLSWKIDSPVGAGWAGTCAISGGALKCGPVTVPAGTTQALSTFKVHISSTTDKSTGGVCPAGNGVVDNTGTVTTSNDSSGQSEATTCVASAVIRILKKADAAQVSAGDPIGFTLIVYNDGTGDAKGVKLSDLLPSKPGLSWSIDNPQGAGWGGSCSITAGVLNCGGLAGVTVPKGTALATSNFTVHVTSPTTLASAGTCPGGDGVVNNTGSVTTTNDGTDESTASTCVAAPGIHIVKAADAAQVNVGDKIGFTMIVYNDGTGDAKGVKLNDPLPAKPGLSWSIDSQGAGWGGTCSITVGVLTCGDVSGVTVPTGTALATSIFTVHVTSDTTADTGGVCPGGSGVIDNTGTVTTTNAGSDQGNASTCVQALVDLAITKTGAPGAPGTPADVFPGNITWTMVVTNNGPSTATGVKVGDPVPAGTTYVAGSVSTTQGTCTGGTIVNCNLGTMANGASVTIVFVTTPTVTGQITNTATVVGTLPETDTTNNSASATVLVVGPHKPPPVYCTAVLVTPSQFYAGRVSTIHLKIVNHGHPVSGVRVQIKGPGIGLVTKPSNKKGQITRKFRPMKAGIITFKPLASKSCPARRIGITGVFTPPVTG